MTRVIRRAILPAVLLIGGIASLVYGTWFHTAPVERGIVKNTIRIEKKTETRKLPIGQPFGQPGVGEPGIPGMPGVPGQDPYFPPGMPVPTIEITRWVASVDKEIENVIRPEWETNLIREATIGGVTLAAGQLKRTYGPTLDGKGPSLPPTLCPT
ncbi:MAG: hypothetical protein ACYTG0_44735 [Planctomycetota bacterium]|jgi:hypothetical protein